MPPGKQTETAVLKRIIEVIEMQNNDMKKYYSDEAWVKLAERREQWTSQMPDAQEKATKAWADLFGDVEASLEEDPAGEKAQALAARWRQLVESFTGCDPEINAGLKNAWADHQNWSPGLQQQTAAFRDKRIWEFMEKTMACRRS